MNSFYLLKDIDFDNSYNHVVSFENLTTQHDYFTNKIVGGFDSVCRYVKPNELTSIVVEIDEQTVQNYSYCMFNIELNGKFKTYYAFILDTKANAENRTILTLEIDVWQTHLFDYELKECFIERSHVTRNFTNCYENENLNVGDTLINERIQKIQDNDIHYALIYCTEKLPHEHESEPHFDDIINGYTYFVPITKNSQVFYYDDFEMIPNPQTESDEEKTYTVKCHNLKTLKELATKYAQIKNIFIVKNINLKPSFTVYNLKTYPLYNDSLPQGFTVNGFALFAYGAYFNYANTTTKTPYNIDNYDISNDIKNYDVKCYTYPYYYYTITNNRGDDYIIKPQFLKSNTLKIMYILSWDMMLKEGVYIDNYININTKTDMSVNTNGSEMLLLSNAFVDYMRANKNSERAGLIANGVGGAFGVIGSVVSGNPMGAVSGVTNSALSVLSLRAKHEDLKNTPNNVRKSGGNWLFDMLGDNSGLELNKVYLPQNQMERLHKDFTRYGYTIKNYQKPNIKSRKYFNFIRNIETNIKSNLPNKLKSKIKQIYNDGVTIWHYSKNLNDVDIGNYDVDNAEV